VDLAARAQGARVSGSRLSGICPSRSNISSSKVRALLLLRHLLFNRVSCQHAQLQLSRACLLSTQCLLLLLQQLLVLLATG
jgi:hypothetical protein